MSGKDKEKQTQAFKKLARRLNRAVHAIEDSASRISDALEECEEGFCDGPYLMRQFLSIYETQGIGRSLVKQFYASFGLEAVDNLVRASEFMNRCHVDDDDCETTPPEVHS